MKASLFPVFLFLPAFLQTRLSSFKTFFCQGSDSFSAPFGWRKSQMCRQILEASEGEKERGFHPSIHTLIIKTRSSLWNNTKVSEKCTPAGVDFFWVKFAHNFSFFSFYPLPLQLTERVQIHFRQKSGLLPIHSFWRRSKKGFFLSQNPLFLLSSLTSFSHFQTREFYIQ